MNLELLTELLIYMTEKIIDLNLTLLKRGEQMFMGCNCGTEDGFAAVVVHGKNNPVVMALICLRCEKEHYLHYGEVTSTRDNL